MGNVYLLRHGQTTWNRDEVFRGQADILLNPFGRRQAEAISLALRQQGLTKPVFLSSPLERARETALIAASFLPQPQVEIDRSFLDICYGEWEGKSRREVEEQYPDLFLTWKERPDRVVFPGGESLIKVADRAEKGIYQAVRHNPEGDTVIVAHSAVNKALLCRLLGAGISSFWRFRQNTACINSLWFEGSYFILVHMNKTCHLKNLEEDDGDL